MTCISPPELEDVVLFAHLAGEANDEVSEHLERCAHCNQRLTSLVSLETQFKARLYRIDCPLPDDLARYHLGVLSDEFGRLTSAHVEECSHCQAEVRVLEKFMAESDTVTGRSGFERVKVLVGRLLSGREATQLAGAGAEVRGTDDGPMVYAAGESLVSISSIADTKEPALLQVAGLLATADPKAWIASLWNRSEKKHECHVDERGNFVFTSIPGDTYDLILSSDSQEIIIPEIRVE